MPCLTTLSCEEAGTRPSAPAIYLRAEVRVWQLGMEGECQARRLSSPQSLLHYGPASEAGSHRASMLAWN